MASNSSLDYQNALTVEKLLVRITLLENTIQDLKLKNAAQDIEFKRLENRVREWQEINLKLQSRLAQKERSA
ncbi:MAG: hypothetical protein K5905_21010 [Roseibium sp.]|uniref:hypothetical protein n=1 Tax=Roseibium sp. TaxID=1936156 RepID=UPI002619243B|nr:hypothetical protein [Roseibium sp.]MCV0427945.1 hypothetical protein [Roseibium sp.]